MSRRNSMVENQRYFTTFESCISFWLLEVYPFHYWYFTLKAFHHMGSHQAINVLAFLQWLLRGLTGEMPLDDEQTPLLNGGGIRKRKTMVPPAEHNSYSSYTMPDHIYVDTACYANHVETVSNHGNEESNGSAEPIAIAPRLTESEDKQLIDWIYEDDGLRKQGNDVSDAELHEKEGNEMRPLLHSDDEASKEEVKKKKKPEEDQEEVESVWAVAFQVFIPFLIAGFGTVAAGLVLDYVQHWKVFQVVSEIFILVPALLGLKGNLEMTLASRLSTQANLGHMDTGKEQWKMAYGNLALIQCQASVVGFLASIFAVIVAWIPAGEFDVWHAMLLCASSLLTATIASLVLGIVMIIVVICSRKLHINPDNVATPIAASLGDLTTLALLASVSSMLFETVGHQKWIMPTLIAGFLMLIPLWVVIAMRNKYTHEVLYSGWSPVISAMAISSIGGLILDYAVSRFKGIAVFQPVINGVGGNLVAVQASRISTYLHQRSSLGTLPSADRRLCMDPCSAFFSSHAHSRTARVLVLMVIPGHLIFTYGIQFLKAGHTSVTILFLVVYLSAAFLQVLLLLYIAHVMIHWMWKKCVDPDNSAIPYLTAIGDLLGTALLAAAFVLLYHIGDRDSDVGD